MLYQAYLYMHTVTTAGTAPQEACTNGWKHNAAQRSNTHDTVTSSTTTQTTQNSATPMQGPDQSTTGIEPVHQHCVSTSEDCPPPGLMATSKLILVHESGKVTAADCYCCSNPLHSLHKAMPAQVQYSSSSNSYLTVLGHPAAGTLLSKARDS